MSSGVSPDGCAWLGALFGLHTRRANRKVSHEFRGISVDLKMWGVRQNNIFLTFMLTLNTAGPYVQLIPKNSC